jgi:hypothetical protein
MLVLPSFCRPGDDYVDWVGLSVYYKGLKKEWPWKTNGLTPRNFVAQQITGGGEGGAPQYNFYQMFCSIDTRNKPMMV